MKFNLKRGVQLQKRQQGGALLVALVMIFMLSLLGISAMRGAALEHRMASNSIQKATVKQAAESATEVALNDWDNLSDAYESASDNTSSTSIDVELQQNIGMTSTAQITYVGKGFAPGYSKGVGSFETLRFIVVGDAKVDAVRAQARIIQGAYKIVPASSQ